MMRIDAWLLATAPVDMRCGMDSLLARVVAVFGAAQPPHSLRLRKPARQPHEGPPARRLWPVAVHPPTTPMQPALAQWRAAPYQPERPTMAGPHRGLAMAQAGLRDRHCVT